MNPLWWNGMQSFLISHLQKIKSCSWYIKGKMKRWLSFQNPTCPCYAGFFPTRGKNNTSVSCKRKCTHIVIKSRKFHLLRTVCRNEMKLVLQYFEQ